MLNELQGNQVKVQQQNQQQLEDNLNLDEVFQAMPQVSVLKAYLHVTAELSHLHELICF